MQPITLEEVERANEGHRRIAERFDIKNPVLNVHIIGDLKDCPLCKSQSVCNLQYNDNVPAYTIRCTDSRDCGIKTPDNTYLEDVVELWNKRHVH